MKDKSLCWKCKYHTYLGNLPSEKYSDDFDKLTEREVENIACYYSVIAKSSALKPNGARKTIDTRGDGPECSLFVEGKRDKSKAKNDFTHDAGFVRGRGRISYDR